MKDMHALGWLERTEDWRDNVSACMEFFGLDALSELDYSEVRVVGARFRAKPKTLRQDAAIAAWVRQVQLEAASLQCDRWDPDSFQEVLPQLAKLSRVSDPREFIPELQRRSSLAGVAVVVVRAPTGCPANGVSMTLPSGVRTIGLSGRYLSDDHMWFTLFHEAAHLILHDHDAIFVDEITKHISRDATGIEAEADHFASESLLPKLLLSGIDRNPSPKAVHGLANRAGVSNGVVVGQLQHLGLVPFNSRLNRLKHRYKWKGTSLSRGKE